MRDSVVTKLLRSARKLAVFGLLTFAGVSPLSNAQALSISIDQYLVGDPNIIPLLPIGTLEINDVAANLVQFDINIAPGVKFVNIGLGLSPTINENQLVLNSLSGDQMSLDIGGWLGFPFKVEFNDRPIHPVSFTLSAPGLDLTDFLGLPGSPKFANSLFALQLWHIGGNDMIDSTVGGNPVPEPATLTLMLLSGVGLAMRRAKRKGQVN